ncbi:MAG: SocA family protein [Methylacidiphilales bacterium]|nr:SocA family protein [Candidatus Methylacidiphilales bacterium]NJR15399.1 SocA family protein [Calothrix sp. CSU_2_0]
MLSCFDVANYFIRLANETGSFLSNLKLQKLVYYAQAWYLAIHDNPLFDEDFQAWIHGPVIPTLYQKYKSFGWQPILEDANPELPQEIQDFLKEVAEEYFACDAYELEQMTHAETPWVNARENLPPDTPSNAVIIKESMKEYYKSCVKED